MQAHLSGRFFFGVFNVRLFVSFSCFVLTNSRNIIFFVRQYFLQANNFFLQKSELFNYIRKNEAYGMKNNSSFEMAQRVLSMLAVVLLVEKNQINFAKEKEFLRSIGISLSLNCINESDVKLIFDEISCFGR